MYLRKRVHGHGCGGGSRAAVGISARHRVGLAPFGAFADTCASGPVVPKIGHRAAGPQCHTLARADGPAAGKPHGGLRVDGYRDRSGRRGSAGTILRRGCHRVGAAHGGGGVGYGNLAVGTGEMVRSRPLVGEVSRSCGGSGEGEGLVLAHRDGRKAAQGHAGIQYGQMQRLGAWATVLVRVFKDMGAALRERLTACRPGVGLAHGEGLFRVAAVVDGEMQDVGNFAARGGGGSHGVGAAFRVCKVGHAPRVRTALGNADLVRLVMGDGQIQGVAAFASVGVGVVVRVGTALRVGCPINVPRVCLAGGDRHCIAGTLADRHHDIRRLGTTVDICTRHRVGGVSGRGHQDACAGASGGPCVGMSSGSDELGALPLADAVVAADTHIGKRVNGDKHHGGVLAGVYVGARYGERHADRRGLGDARARGTAAPLVGVRPGGGERHTFALAADGVALYVDFRQGVDCHHDCLRRGVGADAFRHGCGDRIGAGHAWLGIGSADLVACAGEIARTCPIIADVAVACGIGRQGEGLVFTDRHCRQVA